MLLTSQIKIPIYHKVNDTELLVCVCMHVHAFGFFLKQIVGSEDSKVQLLDWILIS